MRLVEWNCRMAFQKALVLEKLGADLAVIPECSENAVPPSDEFISFLWKGHNPKKVWELLPLMNGNYNKGMTLSHFHGLFLSKLGIQRG